MSKYDVYFWGILCQDIVLRLSGVPDSGVNAAVLEETPAVGGDAANSAHAASSLGLKVILQPNHLGKDDAARFVLRELGRRKHKLTGLERNSYPTVHAYCLALPNGERTIFGSFAHKKISPPSLKLIKNSRAFCLDGYYAAASAPACRIARDAGATIFANDICPSEKHFPLVDYIFLSHPAGDTAGARRFLKLAKKRAKGTVIITMGKDGTMVVDKNGKFYRQKGFKTKVVDSTGAGDCFRASFIYSYLKGWDMRKSLRFAGAFAALSCRGVGATGYLPSLRETEKLMKGL